eukprot:jgi/Psemu1/314530/fgenesh1_kg.1578_\
MMFFQQKSVLLTSIALLAFAANQESGFMVSAQGEDKEDKNDEEDVDDEIALPVEINVLEPSTMINVTDDEMEPLSEDMNTTVFEELDELDEGCVCDTYNSTISCTDPADELVCMCDDMGDVICADVGAPVDSPTVQAAPVATPVAAPGIEPDEPPAPDTGMEAEPDTGMEAETSAATFASAMVSAAVSAAGLVVALN